MKVNLFWPNIHKEEWLEELEKIFETKWIAQAGKVTEFEKEFGEKFNYDYCVALNSGTASLDMAFHLAGINYKTFVLTPVLTCLHYNETVLLEDGSYKKIGDIVKERYDGNVLSYNIITNEIEPKKIINWYENEYNGRWVFLSHKNAQKTNSKILKNKGCFLTPDHKILTSRGYVEVDELRKNEKIVTKYKTFNKKQYEMIIGTLLGESHISNGRSDFSSCRLSYLHSINQKEWVNIKDNALNGIDLTKDYRESYKQSGPCVGSYTKALPILSELRKEWYPNGKKVVSNKIGEHFSEITLATWFLDDGHFSNRKNESVTLCSESFSKEDNEFLCLLLKEKFDIDAKIQKIKRNNKVKYRVYIGNGNNGGIKQKYSNLDKFFGVIYEYIPKSMEYKIPERYKGKFSPDKWKLGKSIQYLDNVNILELDNLPAAVKKKSNKSYCIDVENNHNFISKNMIMHNCTATNIPLVHRKASIEFVDIDTESLTMSYEDFYSKATNLMNKGVNPKDIAVVTVNLGGIECDRRIYEFCYDFKIPVIVDACQSLGVKEPYGDYVCYSFQAIKHFTTGDGGMLVCRREEDYERAKKLRWFGIDREMRAKKNFNFSPSDREMCMNMEEPGFKTHMNDIMATMGLVGLRHSDEDLERRRQIVRRYNKNFRGKVERVYGGSFWLYGIMMDGRDEGKMDKIKESGVECDLIHLRNDIFTPFGEKRRKLPNMNWVEQRYMYIPMHIKLTNEQIDYVSEVVLSVK